MTTAVLIDDHLLLRVLLGDEPTTLRPERATLATTGLWYHRLCRALSGPGVVGALSSRLGGATEVVATKTIAAVASLPETIELLSLRNLGWPMGELVHAGARVNLMSLEALAAARVLSAEVCLARSGNNAPLRAAAKDFGVRVRLVA